MIQNSEDWKDTAIFEAKVARLLTQNYGSFEPCYAEGHCRWAQKVIDGKYDCLQCRLKYARLQVEQEMGDYER